MFAMYPTSQFSMARLWLTVTEVGRHPLEIQVLFYVAGTAKNCYCAYGGERYLDAVNQRLGALNYPSANTTG